MGGIFVVDLYIDISSGANVTELINKIVSSGQVEVDRFVKTMNSRFRSIAQFSYQSMHQDGEISTNLYVESQMVEPLNDAVPEGQAGRTSGILSYSWSDMRIKEGTYVGTYTGEVRGDSIERFSIFNNISISELEQLSERWPAKTQLLGAAFYSILKTYNAGQIYIMDDVKLSNGVSYSVEDAWKHRNYLHAEECAALGALISHAQVLSGSEFNRRIKRIDSRNIKGFDEENKKVYFMQLKM